MRNVDIRAEAKENGVSLWQIAEKMGLSDSAFSRKLRHELPAAEKERILQFISEIAAEEE